MEIINTYTREKLLTLLDEEYGKHFDTEQLKIILNLKYKELGLDITKSPNKLYCFDLKDISNILLTDYNSRLQKKWKLFSIKDIIHLNKKCRDKSVFNTDEMMYVSPCISKFRINTITRWEYDILNYVLSIDNKVTDINDNPIHAIDKYCEFVTIILREFYSHIVIAGGIIAKAFNNKFHNELIDGSLGICSDIDFFFIGENRVEEIISYTWDLINKKYPKFVVITRNQNVTTIAYSNDRNREINDIAYHGVKLQFIHRIYPSADMVIGGFDIGPSMVLYDGYKIKATALGAFSIATHSLVVDLTRRSTSFEHRIKKYNMYGFGVIILKDSNKYITDKAKRSIFNITSYQPANNLTFDLDNSKNKFVGISNYNISGKSDYNGNEGIKFTDYNVKYNNAVFAFNGQLDYISWRSMILRDIYNPKLKYAFGHFGMQSIFEKHGSEAKETIKQNMKVAQEMADKGIKIIVDDPCTQSVNIYDRRDDGKLHTSSFNPIIEDVRKYYLNSKTGYCKIGISDDIYVLLRLINKEFSMDVINMIMDWLRVAISNDTENMLFKT